MRSATVRHLTKALAPEGRCSIDGRLRTAADSLRAEVELQIFRRFTPARPRPRGRHVRPATPRAPGTPVGPEPVALHLRALVHIERGEKKRAEKELNDLASRSRTTCPVSSSAPCCTCAWARRPRFTLMRRAGRMEKLPGDELCPALSRCRSASTAIPRRPSKSARGGPE